MYFSTFNRWSLTLVSHILKNPFWVSDTALEVWWSTSICIPAAPTRISSFSNLISFQLFPSLLHLQFCTFFCWKYFELHKTIQQSVHVSCLGLGQTWKVFELLCRKPTIIGKLAVRHSTLYDMMKTWSYLDFYCHHHHNHGMKRHPALCCMVFQTTYTSPT